MIHINNAGSGNPNLTFRFGFQNSPIDTKLNVGGKSVAIPLVINGGPINGRFPARINVRENYNISLASAAGEQAVTMAANGAQYFDKPIDNVGMKSIPDYETYALQHVYEIKVLGCANNGRVFVGQRKDPFVVNLGQVFNLVHIAKPATEFDPNAETLGKDDLDDKNVTSIVLELPIACVTTSATRSSAHGRRQRFARRRRSMQRRRAVSIPAQPRRAASSRCRGYRPRSSTSS